MNKKLEALLFGAALAAAPLASEARPGGHGGHGGHGPAPMHHGHHLGGHHFYGPRPYVPYYYDTVWAYNNLYYQQAVYNSLYYQQVATAQAVANAQALATAQAQATANAQAAANAQALAAAQAQANATATTQPASEIKLEPGDTVEKRPDGTVIIKKAAAPVYQDNQNVRQQ